MITPLRVRKIGLLVVLLSLAASGFYWWQIENAGNQLRSETVAQAELRAKQLNGAVADQVAILIRYVDFAAQELAENYVPGKDKAFLDQAHKIEQRFPPQSLLQIAVIDAKGYLAHSTLGVKERVYLADREHFRTHLGSAKPHLFVSAPVFGRVSKQWSIQFSRPILHKGRFEGVVVISLAPSYLQKTLAALSLESDDSIAIFRQSGEYLARNLRNEEVLGKHVGPNRPFLGPDAAPSGLFITAANFDKVVRIFQWQRLSDAPIIVVLGISEATLLRPVDAIIAKNRWQAAVASGILWLFTFGVIILLHRLSVQQRMLFASARQVQHMAFYDSLTNLPNRRLLNDRLGQTMAAQKRNARFAAMIFIDLDNFKQLNDLRGHAVGDLLLKEAASRLKSCVRNVDTVSRFGGDEFVLMIGELGADRSGARARVAAIAEKIRAELSRGYELKIEHEGTATVTIAHQCTASIGIALFDGSEGTQDDILNWADQAMYRAKVAGRNTIRFYGDGTA